MVDTRITIAIRPINVSRHSCNDISLNYPGIIWWDEYPQIPLDEQYFLFPDNPQETPLILAPISTHPPNYHSNGITMTYRGL